MAAGSETNVLAQPLRRSANGRYFTTADGAPFFWLGDTAWELTHRLGEADIELYLQDRADKGYNVVQTVALAELGGLTLPNERGEMALLDNNPETPNPRYFEYVDWMIEQATARGIRIALVPTWGAYVTGGWVGDTIIFNESNAFAYGRWLGERYRDRGIVWLNGGDTNPIWRKARKAGFDPLVAGEPVELVDYSAVFDALARGILAGGGDDQFILYHPTAVSLPGTPAAIASAYYGDRDWLAADAVQTGHARDRGAYGWDSTRSYEPITTMWNASPTRPVIDLENHYEDFWIDFDQANRMWDDADIRNGAYQAVFAGAAGAVYGNWNIWQMHDTNFPVMRPTTATWRESLSSPGAAQLVHLKNLMLSRTYETRVPAPELIVGDAGEGERHVAATRDSEGSYALVYLPFGEPAEIDLSAVGAQVSSASWFSPIDGSVQPVSEPLDAATQRFVPPTTGRGNDWVLILKSAGMDGAARKD